MRIASAVASAIECVTRIGSKLNGPRSNALPDVHRRDQIDLVDVEAVLGEALPRELERVRRPEDGHVEHASRYGSAPM